LRAGNVRRDALEDLSLLAQIFQFQHRETAIFFAAKRGDANQAVGVAIGQGAQQQRVDEAEDGGVRADSQRQRQRDNESETGLFDERPRAVAQVLPECFHERLLESFPTRLLENYVVERRR
jgi:hypothetical protein